MHAGPLQLLRRAGRRSAATLGLDTRRRTGSGRIAKGDVEERQQGKVTLRLEYVHCGTEACHYTGDEGHGPYWYAYYRKAGRLTSEYIGKDLGKFTLG